MAKLEELLPIPDENSQPFFAGALAGKLVIQRCGACGRPAFPYRSTCAGCGAEGLDWFETSGRGHVYMHGVVHQAFHPELADAVPYPLAVVELEEGIRFTTRLVDVDPNDIRAGMPVEVTFKRLAENVAIPVFAPPGTAGHSRDATIHRRAEGRSDRPARSE